MSMTNKEAVEVGQDLVELQYWRQLHADDMDCEAHDGLTHALRISRLRDAAKAAVEMAVKERTP